MWGRGEGERGRGERGGRGDRGGSRGRGACRVGGLFPALQLAVMCVGWGGGREGGELAVIARVVGEGAAYPLTHFFPALRLAVMCGGGRGGGSWRSKQV